MRKHGTIEDVRFKLQKWCIRQMQYQYMLFYGGRTKLVYVDSMKELRQRIAEFALEEYRDDNYDDDDDVNEHFY